MMNLITDYLMEFWSIGVLIFFGMQLVNVILSTIKTILTVGASENSAVAISVVYYTFYNGLVKILTQQPLVVVLTTTAITNAIGMKIAYFILKKTKKPVLWKVEGTILGEHTAEMRKDLEDAGLSNKYMPDIGKYTEFSIYCETREESKKTKEILKKYDAKYFVAESKVL